MNTGERIGDYEIVQILGTGGMGQVYKVRNVLSDRIEAMKVLLPNLEGDPGLADRFLNEIKVQASLDHPNIAKLHTAMRSGNQLVMVMEFVDGVSLSQLLQSGPLAPSIAAAYASQVLDALLYAHAHGVIHRDIKPANIMLTFGGRIELMDFGIARVQADRRLTQTGGAVGSLLYMSPEQIRGSDPDGRSDLYSLGITMYEMVTGRRPFHGDSDFQIMSAHLQQVPMPPMEIIAGIPSGLSDIILMAIEKEPAARFQSAEAFRAALGRAFPAVVTPTRTMAPVAPTLPVVTPLSSLRTAESLGISPAPARSRRGLYVTLSSVAALALLVTAFIEGPKLMHGGASGVQGVHPTPPVVAAPAPVPSAPQAPPQSAPPAVEAAQQAVKAQTREPVKPPLPAKSSAANAAKENAYQKAYEEGMLLLSQRKWADGADRLSEAIRLKPNSALAYLGRCRAATAQDDYRQAIADCTQVIQRLPNSAAAFHDRGSAYLETKQFERAVEDMNAALRLGDDAPAIAHSIRGRAHSGLKEWSDAIQDFDEAIKLNPNVGLFFMHRGIALNARSQYRKAIKDFDEALRLQPHLSRAYTHRAFSKTKLGDTAGAAADREQAKSLHR